MAAPPTDPSSFTILYFAAASTYTGKSSERLQAPLSVASLFTVLESRYPGITARVLKSCAVTVNLDYVDLEDGGDEAETASGGGDVVASAVGNDRVVIEAGDEVGIIPPVSSG